jgi:hypothetical protein
VLQHILCTMGNDVEASGYRLCCCSVLDSMPHDDNDCALNSQVGEGGQLLCSRGGDRPACAGLDSSPQIRRARRWASAAGAQRRRRTKTGASARVHRPRRTLDLQCPNSAATVRLSDARRRYLRQRMCTGSKRCTAKGSTNSAVRLRGVRGITACRLGCVTAPGSRGS